MSALSAQTNATRAFRLKDCAHNAKTLILSVMGYVPVMKVITKKTVDVFRLLKTCAQMVSTTMVRTFAKLAEKIVLSVKILLLFATLVWMASKLLLMIIEPVEHVISQSVPQMVLLIVPKS